MDNETWTSTINIVWDGTDVTVTGSADGVTVKSSNGYVTVTSTVKNIEYAVSGNGTGQLTIYSDYKFKLSLEGLTLVCSDGPAINNQSHKRTYVVVKGSNTLSDGASYTTTPEDEDEITGTSDSMSVTVCMPMTASLSTMVRFPSALRGTASSATPAV